MAVNASPSILEFSEALSGENTDVYYICARIGFNADSLKPLEKLQDLGFTPEAILDLYVTCDHNTDRMITEIQELDSDFPPLKARSSDLSGLTGLCDLLSGGDLKIARFCILLALRADSLEPLEKLQAHGFTPEAIVELHEETCNYDTDLMIRKIQELD